MPRGLAPGPAARPWSGRPQGPAKVRRQAGAELPRGVVSCWAHSAFRRRPQPQLPNPGDIPSQFSEALWNFETKAPSLSLWTFFSNTWKL